MKEGYVSRALKGLGNTAREYTNRALQNLGDGVRYAARPVVLGATVTTAILPGCVAQRASIGKWFAGEEKIVKVGYTEPMKDDAFRDLTQSIADEMLLVANGLPDLAVDIGQYLHDKLVETEKAAAASAVPPTPYVAPTINLDDWRLRTLVQLEAERANITPELQTRLDRQWKASLYVADNMPEARAEAARRASRTAVPAGGKHAGVTQAEIDAQDATDLPTLWNRARGPAGAGGAGGP